MDTLDGLALAILGFEVGGDFVGAAFVGFG